MRRARCAVRAASTAANIVADCQFVRVCEQWHIRSNAADTMRRQIGLLLVGGKNSTPKASERPHGSDDEPASQPSSQRAATEADGGLPSLRAPQVRMRGLNLKPLDETRLDVRERRGELKEGNFIYLSVELR